MVVRPGKMAERYFVFMKKREAADKWKKKLSCTAWIGSRGLGKQKEGDKKTPKGFYPLGRSLWNLP